MTRNSPADSPALRRTEWIAWILFLTWSTVGAVVMPLGIGPATVREHVVLPPLRDGLLAVLRVSDAVWMVLAAAVVYLFALRTEGIALSRVRAVIILAGSAAIETVGALTGWPFGPYHYTDNLGQRIAGVLPFTIPLAWLVVVLGSRYLVLWLRPRWGRWKIALGTGALALLTDLNLEFVAWKARAYWIWYPPGHPLAYDPPAWPPLQNYVSWFAVAFLLCAALPRVEDAPRERPLRPVAVLAVMNAIFLLVHLARAIGATGG